MPHLCPQSNSHAFPRHEHGQRGARVSKIMPREGVGVALGAQARHVVTYRDPLVAPYLTPFLPKSVKHGAKRGYPLFLTGFELAPPS